MSQTDTRRAATVVGLVSASTGTGRTGAITNLAWILASGGKRVLVVDWGTERPSVHDYLRPFLVAEPSVGELDIYPNLFPTPDPDSRPVGVYAVPAGAHSIHVLGGRADAGPEPPTGQPRVARWEKQLHELDYDYVLVDGPTDISPDGLDRMSALCDVVLVFFLPRRSAVAQAGEIARAIAAACVPGPRIIPVTSQFDDQNDQRAKRSRETIRETFAGLSPLPVEIPYHPYDEYDEALAVLVDEPGRPGTLLAAYERLADAVSEGAVDALTPPPAATRDRYRHRLGLPAPATAWRIAVAYAAPDRPWADWVRQRLERAGATVLMASPDREWPAGVHVPSLVVISSPHLSDSPAVTQIARITEARGDAAPVDVIGVRVPSGDQMAGSDADPSVRITVGSRPELEVGGELLARFGLFDEPGEQGRAAIRFPGDLDSPVLHNLPPRSETFTGRDAELEDLRDRVTSQNPIQRVACTGPSGVGRSELLREYAHRFGFHYDLVWWIPAHDPVAVQAGLLRLADLKSTAETGDTVHEVLHAISAGEWYERSLLVYDNVTDFDALEELGLLPEPGAVDVLATTQVQAPGWDVLEVGKFTPAESRALLRSRVPALTVADADRVGAALGLLPLAVELAASWLSNTVVEFRGAGESTMQAAEHAAGDLVEHVGASTVDEQVVARMLGLARTSLTRTPRGRLAMRIAEMCAFLSAEGVALRLLHSPAFLTQLYARAGQDADGPRYDTGEVDQVLWAGARYGLYEVSWGEAGRVVMHRALRTVLRTDENAAETRSLVLAGLAAYAPSEVSDWSAGTRAKFDELQRHIFVSGALAADEPAVRRWLVNHLRFLYVTGDGVVWRFALGHAEQTAERWASAVGPDDELLLRMRGQIANLHRALGDFARAREIDEAVLDTQRRKLGNRHRQTLISTRARAADLRSAGRYEEAFAEDHEAREGLRETLGEDHEHTRMAAHNLAISAHLTGDTRTALAIQRDHHARQARLLGRHHPSTWMSAASAGVYLRELGRYQEAADVLTEALHVLNQANRGGRQPDALWIEWQLAIVRRRQGNHLWARESNTKTVKLYGELYGQEHPNTRGCRLSLAADHHAYGDDARAVALARECLAGYLRDAPEHPVTAVCRMNLALYLRAAGEWDEARRDGEAVVDTLTELLGVTHPWTLNATNNLVTTLASRGELATARDLAEQNDRLCRDVLGPEHPYSLVSGRNLAHLRERPGGWSWDELDIDVLPI